MLWVLVVDKSATLEKRMGDWCVEKNCNRIVPLYVKSFDEPVSSSRV